MRPITMVLMACAVVASAAAQVTPEEHAAHHPPQAATSQGTPGDMHQHMKEMRSLMEKIEKTSDPAERQRLLDQHRKAMREQMNSMMQLDDDKGMGKSGKMMECHEHMQGQMEMMMGMMDQLMRHEDAARGTRKK